MVENKKNEEYIKNANIVHNNNYDYSLTNYINSRSKIIIICKVHGEFTQRASHHTNGTGCPKCSGKNKTINEIIEDFGKKHNYKYTYNLDDYKNKNSIIKITCPLHGEFKQIASSHNSGKGCPKCGRNSSTKEEFIDKANIIHNNELNYDKVIYENNKTEVIITCKIHGDFKQRPDMHLQGQGCPRCSKVDNYDDFLEKANRVHNNKYIYPKFIWNNSKDKIDIICEKHGIFKQIINDHLNGSGCRICNLNILTETDFFNKTHDVHKDRYDYSETKFNKKKIDIICKEHGKFTQNMWSHVKGAGCPKCAHTNLTTEEVIPLFDKVHNFLYDYSNTKYIKSDEKVKIICKIHGEFEQSPNHHLRGKGCPNCKKSKGEIAVKRYLEENNINFTQQKTFDDCRYKQLLYFDFYLPDKNMCIEYDGEQHFRTSEFFGGEENLKVTQLRDKIKTDYCLNNNITLIRIKYNENILESLKNNI